MMVKRGFLYYLIMALVIIALIGGLVNTFDFPLWMHLVLAAGGVVIYSLNLIFDIRKRKNSQK